MTRSYDYTLGEAERIGAAIGTELAPGDVVLLSGDLGAGKTTLARAMLKARGLAGEAPSPTFAIVQPYAPPEVDLAVAHVDLYRIEGEDELVELGLDDYREGAVLIAEWSENAGGFAGEPGCLSILLEIADEGRKAVVEGGADWLGRMP